MGIRIRSCQGGIKLVKGAVESFIQEVRGQWRLLWRDRIDDHVRAEGVANQDYDKLFVERGTIVLATRNFKFLTLREILEQHKIVHAEYFVPANPQLGGWAKFGRAYAYKRANKGPTLVAEAKRPQQLKKGGRGWLHK
jgi:hypothetical protein